MPHDVTGDAAGRSQDERPWPTVAAQIWRAAPTRLAFPRRAGARSRRWLVVGGIVVAALLAGASVALAATSSGPASHSAGLAHARLMISSAAPARSGGTRVGRGANVMVSARVAWTAATAGRFGLALAITA